MEDFDHFAHLGRAGDPLLDDPLRSDERFCQIARDHQARLNAVIRRKPPRPWLPGTEPAALKVAMRRHWPRDIGRRVLRIVIRGGQPWSR